MGTHPIFESDFDCLTEWAGLEDPKRLKRQRVKKWALDPDHGEDLMINLIAGLKPASLTLASNAVLTNQQAICPSSRLLAERDDVTTYEEALEHCRAIPECSHYSLDLTGSRSTPSDKGRLVLC